MSFLEPDYDFAQFCVGGDSILVLGWSDDEPMYFAIAHLGSELMLRCETVVQTYPDGRQDTTDILRSARIGSYTSAKWWRGVVAMVPQARADSWFDALAESLTENPRHRASCR